MPTVTAPNTSTPTSTPTTEGTPTVTDTVSTPSTSEPSTLTPLRGAALEAVLVELAAIPETEVLAPRIDVPAAVTTAIGAAPEILVHREALIARFGAERARAVDRLVPLAHALNLAHGESIAAVEQDLEPLARALGETRARLVTDAEVLIKRKVLDTKALAGLIGGQAYQDRSTDVLSLLGVFRRSWPKIARHTKWTPAELDSAQAMAEHFVAVVARRQQATAGASEPGRLRARAFTLFFRTYDLVRQMIGYVRWHQGDADQIAPSLYAGRTRSRGSETDIGLDEPAPTTTTPIAPGMPGAEPFSRV